MQLQSLSTKPGVYLFLGKDREVLYVGKAKNLKNRVSSYFKTKIELGPKTQALISQIAKIRTIEASSEIEALLLEASYIKKFKPKYNTRLMDGKAYPLIRITIKDIFPKVLITRKKEDKNSIYFGPYPTSGSLKLTLKMIRKIFPFQSVLNHPKKNCLYYHLGLCPCPSVISKKDYKKNISHIIAFLKGDTGKVIRDLKKEREFLSRNEEFEKANAIQTKINAVELITGPFYKGFDFEVNPNLNQDLRESELLELKSVLQKHEIKVSNLKRIECFDISNISGTNATGSMVVFINCEKDTSQYRRFKIKYVKNKPDDFAMMQEVLQRRLNHKEWSFPDLIIVDGGKGQVSSVMEVLKEKNLNISVIGLAKREETIITSDFDEIKLPKDSEVLKLIMRIRDEAHRFAISYHRKLRSRAFLY